MGALGIVGNSMEMAAAVGGPIGSFLAQSSLARRQKERANRLLNQANVLTAPELQKEFLENKALAEKQAIEGFAGKDLVQNRLNSNTANMLSGARLSTTDSGALLAAISAVQGDANAKMTDLGIQDAQMKNQALDNVRGATMNIASEKNRLDAIKREEQSKLRKQASALEDASTTNEMQSIQDLIKNSAVALSNAGAAVSSMDGKSKGADLGGEGDSSSMAGATEISQDVAQNATKGDASNLKFTPEMLMALQSLMVDDKKKKKMFTPAKDGSIFNINKT